MSNYHDHYHNGVLCADKRCESKESTDTRVPEILISDNSIDAQHDSSGRCAHNIPHYMPCALCAAEHGRAAVVNHPSHYGGDTTYEAIKVIEAWELTFNTGNAVKYICRAGHKDPSISKHIEDLEKSREYLRFEVERLKRQKV